VDTETGRPYTVPSGAYSVGLLDGSIQNFYTVTDKNAQRLPDYHRADISVNYKPDPIMAENAGRQAKGFRKTPTNSNFDQIKGSDFTYYGRHRVILYHVLSDYATLYQQNSNSSQNLINPSSAIVNGYGIFTGINSDTLYVVVKEP
jgi:hypothetical protein